MTMTGPEIINAIAAMGRGGMRYVRTENYFGCDWVVYELSGYPTDA